MAEALKNTEQLRALPKQIDSYFTSLAAGKPKKPNIPSFTADEVGAILMTELDDNKNVPAEEVNDILDAAKVGFTVLKFEKVGTPYWCVGYKLTGTKYYPDTSDTEEDTDATEGS